MAPHRLPAGLRLRLDLNGVLDVGDDPVDLRLLRLALLPVLRLDRSEEVGTGREYLSGLELLGQFGCSFVDEQLVLPQLLPEAVEQFLVEGLLVLDLDAFLEVLLQLAERGLEVLAIAEVGLLQHDLDLLLHQDHGLQGRLLVEVHDVEGFLQAVVQVLVAEEEEDEQFLRAQFCARLLVLPDDLARFLVVLEDGHGDDHGALHEVLEAEVVGDPALVDGFAGGLLEEHHLEEDAERLGQLAHLALPALDELPHEDRDRVHRLRAHLLRTSVPPEQQQPHEGAPHQLLPHPPVVQQTAQRLDGQNLHVDVGVQHQLQQFAHVALVTEDLPGVLVRDRQLREVELDREVSGGLQRDQQVQLAPLLSRDVHPVERHELLDAHCLVETVQPQQDQPVRLVLLREVLLDHRHEIVHADARPQPAKDEDDGARLHTLHEELVLDLSELGLEGGQQACLALRLHPAQVGLHDLPFLQQRVLLGVVPLGHDLLELDLVVVRPERLHRRARLVQQVVGVAQQRQVEVGQHHLALVERLLAQRRTDVIVLEAGPVAAHLEVLQLRHDLLQRVEHLVAAHLIRRLLQAEQLQALVDRPHVPPLQQLQQHPRQLHPRRHTLLEDRLRVRSLHLPQVLQPDKLGEGQPAVALAQLLQLVGDSLRETAQLVHRQLLHDAAHQAVEQRVEVGVDQQHARSEELHEVSEAPALPLPLEETREVAERVLLDRGLLVAVAVVEEVQPVARAHLLQAELLPGQFAQHDAANIRRFVPEADQHAVHVPPAEGEVGDGHLADLFVVLRGQDLEELELDLVPQLVLPPQHQGGQLDADLLVGGDLQAQQEEDRLQDVVASGRSDHRQRLLHQVEHHPRSGNPDAQDRGEDALRQEIEEKVEQSSRRPLLLAQQLREERGCQLLELLGHLPVGLLVEDLEYLQVGQLEGAGEGRRITAEEPSQLENLRLGGGLHLVDLAEDLQHGLRSACWLAPALVLVLAVLHESIVIMQSKGERSAINIIVKISSPSTALSQSSFPSRYRPPHAPPPSPLPSPPSPPLRK